METKRALGNQPRLGDTSLAPRPGGGGGGQRAINGNIMRQRGGHDFGLRNARGGETSPPSRRFVRLHAHNRTILRVPEP